MPEQESVFSDLLRPDELLAHESEEQSVDFHSIFLWGEFRDRVAMKGLPDYRSNLQHAALSI
jgi:hypothetical protein